jgi:hypothetical protein
VIGPEKEDNMTHLPPGWLKESEGEDMKIIVLKGISQ